MTVQYNGEDSYTIFIGNRKLILSKTEIDKIQSYSFEREEYVDSIDKLLFKVENLTRENADLIQTIDYLEEN